MHDVTLLIGGQSRSAANGATFERRNPVSDAVASRAAAATLEDADAAVQAAADAFPAWAALPPGERRKRLLNAAELMDQHTDAFIRTGAAETGASPNWIGFNVMLAANMLRQRQHQFVGYPGIQHRARG